MAVVATWDAADASGIHNVFRYAFNVPAGAFTNSPLLDIAIEGGSAVVKTPPAANTADFVLSVVESSDVGRGGDAEEAARRGGAHRVHDGKCRLSLLSPLGDRE